jgi:hypothetical protein
VEAEVLEDRLGEAGVIGRRVMASVVPSLSNRWVENVYCFADSVEADAASVEALVAVD